MIEEWAKIILEDYDANRPNSVFSKNNSINLDQAYAIQSEVCRLRRSRGEKIIGYKVGCVSEVTRKQMGVDHSVAGRLYENEVHQTNCHLSLNQFCNLGIEGELAIELSKTPVEEDFFENQIPRCVKRVFPVIELHNITFSGVKSTVQELVATNAIHAGFVESIGSSSISEEKIPSMKIHFDNQLIEDHIGMTFISIINSSLKWLINVLVKRGEELEKGQIILTGTIPRLIPVENPCHIKVDAFPFGSVETTITE